MPWSQLLATTRQLPAPAAGRRVPQGTLPACIPGTMRCKACFLYILRARCYMCVPYGTLHSITMCSLRTFTPTTVLHLIRSSKVHVCDQFSRSCEICSWNMSAVQVYTFGTYASETSRELLPHWGKSALPGPAPAGTSPPGLQQPPPAVVSSALLPAGGPGPSPAQSIWPVLVHCCLIVLVKVTLSLHASSVSLVCRGPHPSDPRAERYNKARYASLSRRLLCPELCLSGTRSDTRGPLLEDVGMYLGARTHTDVTVAGP